MEISYQFPDLEPVNYDQVTRILPHHRIDCIKGQMWRAAQTPDDSTQQQRVITSQATSIKSTLIVAAFATLLILVSIAALLAAYKVFPSSVNVISQLGWGHGAGYTALGVGVIIGVVDALLWIRRTRQEYWQAYRQKEEREVDAYFNARMGDDELFAILNPQEHRVSFLFKGQTRDGMPVRYCYKQNPQEAYDTFCTNHPAWADGKRFLSVDELQRHIS